MREGSQVRVVPFSGKYRVAPPIVEGLVLVLFDYLVLKKAYPQFLLFSDVFRWNLTKNGSFSVDSMYNALIQPELPVDNNSKIWKMKIPLRTKIFAWYLRRG
jgi:hypothetical protein